MDDLNDLYYYCKVVEYEGFSAASKVLGVSRSKLSRRIGQLEEKYNIVLIQRSTRQFSITSLGQAFYERCLAMLIEAEAAHHLITNQQAEPQGTLRISCPTTLLQYRIGPLLNQFMQQYPKVKIQLMATNRRVDVISEALDIAFRVRFPPLEDSTLVLKTFTESHQRLVASPHLLAQFKPIQNPTELSDLPSLDWFPPRRHTWHLVNAQEQAISITHQPKYLTDDLTALLQAAKAGIGVVQLPCMVVENELLAGNLVDVLPGWAPAVGLVHAVYPSRRGLLPSVRLLIDYIDQHLVKPA